METFSLAAIALFGLLTGLGHCIGMCGGIVVAYSSAKLDAAQSKRYQFLGHLSYGLGRTTTYAVLGALVGAMGSLFSVTPTLRAVLLAVAGAVMIVMGFSLLGKLRFLSSAQQGGVSGTAWYKRTFSRLVKSPSFGSFYGIGLLNGLIPCGPVYAALVMTLPAASLLGGAAGMAVFGLATIPALLVLGMMVGFMKQFHYRDLFNRLAAIAVILFGVYTLFKAWRIWMQPVMMMHGVDDGGASCH